MKKSHYIFKSGDWYVFRCRADARAWMRDVLASKPADPAKQPRKVWTDPTVSKFDHPMQHRSKANVIY